MKQQTFWKGSAILLISAMLTKVLGACFKIPLTNVLGGTGMGYFSTAYGLLLPVYALSVTGLSAAVSQTVSRAAALRRWKEGRCIRRAALLACGVLGLLLSCGILLLAEPFTGQVAKQPYAVFSVLAIAPAALFGCLTAVERGYWEGLQTMTPDIYRKRARCQPCAVFRPQAERSKRQHRGKCAGMYVYQNGTGTEGDVPEPPARICGG